MCAIRRTFLAGCGIFLLSWPAYAYDAIHWQTTLENARTVASQGNRLLLIHFWGTYCQPCRVMEQDVFPRPEVVAAINASYVAVKVDTINFPTTAQQYGVVSVPTDVIVSPNGRVLAKFEGFAAAEEYAGRLNRLAAPPAVVASLPAGPAGFDRQPASAIQPGGAYVPATSPFDNRYADNYRQPNPQPMVTGPQPAAAPLQAPPASATAATSPLPAPPSLAPPPASPTAAPAVPGLPPLVLDGYCAVQLVDKSRWVPGDRRWGAFHRGHTYLFAGPEEQKQFLANPDKYTPVLSGIDVVLVVDRGETVAGSRSHGGKYANRLYLFASQESLQRFNGNKDYYVKKIQEAMRSNGVASTVR